MSQGRETSRKFSFSLPFAHRQKIQQQQRQQQQQWRMSEHTLTHSAHAVLFLDTNDEPKRKRSCTRERAEERAQQHLLCYKNE